MLSDLLSAALFAALLQLASLPFLPIKPDVVLNTNAFAGQ
jgi:hypothetical protein